MQQTFFIMLNQSKQVILTTKEPLQLIIKTLKILNFKGKANKRFKIIHVKLNSELILSKIPVTI